MIKLIIFIGLILYAAWFFNSCEKYLESEQYLKFFLEKGYDFSNFENTKQISKTFFRIIFILLSITILIINK